MIINYIMMIVSILERTKKYPIEAPSEGQPFTWLTCESNDSMRKINIFIDRQENVVDIITNQHITLRYLAKKKTHNS